MADILEVPITEERPWVVFAACKDADPDLFFIEPDGDPRPAVALCNVCTVRQQCLDYAVEARLRDGIWGGMTPKQRRRFIKRSA